MLQGEERPAPESVRIGGAARLQLAGLIPVAQAHASAAARLDPLLQACVVWAAEVITHACDGRVQAPTVLSMAPNGLAPLRRAVSTTVRMAASPSAAHMAR